MTRSSAIEWPAHYQPENSPVHVRNELDMAATPDQVWRTLIAATRWPDWYFNSARVEILESVNPELQLHSRFRWTTFGVRITSCVREYVPNERISWDARAPGLDVYHAWVLQASEKGCLVLTEETQHGWLARSGKLLMPKRMFNYHQRWLEALEGEARRRQIQLKDPLPLV